MSELNGDIVDSLKNGELKGFWEPIVGESTEALEKEFVISRSLPNESSSQKVIFEARRILSFCNSPESRDVSRTGLVCGRVQSGKTASITAVSAIARDNNFRTVILIAGVTTNLVTQNRERIEHLLRTSSPQWSWHMLTNPTEKTSLQTLQSVKDEWKSPLFGNEDKRTLFITVMKNHSHLRNLSALLNKVDLSEFPTIIFDDEADQASLNTRPNDPTSSTVYREIGNLRSALPRHTYLQYTATPQAPLLITRIDSLSADFAELVSPGEDYTGGESFFNVQTQHVHTIPNTDIFDDSSIPLEPPETLIKALRAFFVGVAVGHQQRSKKHRSMLVHPSRTTNTHRHYYDWINGLKTHWSQLLQNTHEPDSASLLLDFRTEYDAILSTQPNIPGFTDLEQLLPLVINKTSVWLVNSKDGSEIEWENSYSHILVGGEKLGRGYTVKGLTVTYMPRNAGGWTADTIQQRARFFGYHNEYLGLCRIFLHPDVRDAYNAYLTHEKDMRQRLSDFRGRPLKEWRRLFYLDRQLEPTRKNVLSSPYLRPDFSDGWYSPKAPHMALEYGKWNRDLISSVLQLSFVPDKNYPQNLRATVSLKEFFSEVLAPLSYFHEDDSLGLCVVNCNIATLLERSPDLACHLLVMHNGNERLRRLKGGVIPQFFQGRSSAGAASYPGDRAFFESKIPTIQIHYFRIEDGPDAYSMVPAVAIHLSSFEDTLVHIE